MEEKLKEVLKNKNWKFSKCNELKPFIKYIENKTKELNLDSRGEYIYHLQNNFKITEHICTCGNKKKFRGTPSKRYGEFCSTKCSNKYNAQNKEMQKKKSESCKKHYKEYNTAKDRGKDVSKFYKNLKEENPKLYEEYRLKKDKTLRDIWNSFSKEKLREIKEKMSESSKIWFQNLDQETKNKIIKASNQGFKYFLKNMDKEEKELYYRRSQENREKTNNKKYGCHPNKLQETKNKIKETTFNNYGVEYITQLQETKDKIRKTNEENKNWITEDQVQNFKDYSKLVWRYTNQNNLTILENFELRGHANKGMYHLDHKFSIFEGYKNNIPAYIIGHICNLEMIIGRNNLSKNKKGSITLKELLNQIKAIK